MAPMATPEGLEFLRERGLRREAAAVIDAAFTELETAHLSERSL